MKYFFKLHNVIREKGETNNFRFAGDDDRKFDNFFFFFFFSKTADLHFLQEPFSKFRTLGLLSANPTTWSNPLKFIEYKLWQTQEGYSPLQVL